MNAKPVTQAEAKAVWDSLENPSPRKVAEKLDAAGQPVDCGIIAQWERDGWPGASVAELVQPDPKTSEPEKAESMQVELMKAEPPGLRSYAQRAEDVMFKVISTSESLLDSIRNIATAVPGDGGAAEEARTAPALKAADSIAKLMKASSEAANMAIEGLRQIPALRTDDADGLHGEEAYPSRAAIEAIDQALKKVREGKP
jgi:hypothetical protein